MNLSKKKLLIRLYRQCDDLATYSHNISATQCDTAFRWVRDVLLFIKSKSNSEEDCDSAIEASDNLESLIDEAVNEDWIGHTSTGQKWGVRD